ncbi:hypothetical protein CK203_015125 [Vitis vinifera]|uniref:K-box domain-containing protein n=1 Tax=Vitis vinifera TaxID=29760 RepID=A0A438JDD5_VITVI|nr:hypothetical protein CK203_015125 [Vitis vinifera]
MMQLVILLYLDIQSKFPTSYTKIVLDPNWQQVMAEELSTLHWTDTCDLVPLPLGKSSIGSHLGFLRNIIESYLQISRDAEANVGSSSHEAKQKRYPVRWAGADLLKIVESQVEGPRIEQLRLSELSQLEQKLDGMLRQTRRRKTQLMMEAIACLKEKVKELNEQKQQMEKMIAAAESKDALQHEDLVMEQAGNNSKPPPQNVVLQLL